MINAPQDSGPLGGTLSNYVTSTQALETFNITVASMCRCFTLAIIMFLGTLMRFIFFFLEIIFSIRVGGSLISFGRCFPQ